MMRGGHRDACVLGAYQVAAKRDLANWSTGKPGAIPPVGGAMDLAVGAKKTVVVMTLFTKAGTPTLVPLHLPVDRVGCVSRVYTDHGVFLLDAKPGVVVVREVYGTTLGELRERLEVPLEVAG